MFCLYIENEVSREQFPTKVLNFIDNGRVFLKILMADMTWLINTYLGKRRKALQGA